MFTGIVEATGVIKKIDIEGTNKTFTIEADFATEMGVNASLSHNGVCLTIVNVAGNTYQVTAVQETLIKSNLGELNEGDIVNLERAMASGYRFDGHIVQGHVDQTGICTYREEVDGSWLFDFEYDYKETGNFLVEKGSVCIDGVSLTVFNVKEGSFRVTIIPHTMNVTNFKTFKVGTKVNLEFDVIGKYIKRLFDLGYKEAIMNK
ncbi:MAG: riboflavin synthase [Cyclobacteriaceae bacterium]|nr:riboflavin synthase [Cyclobacteriaceae bacterium]MCK5367881.1 riboflavin synthase [Cyclobacteriaceae bacterium]